METFFGYLANWIPPWSAYRAFMYGRLIVLGKKPGMCPFRVGETWILIFSKIALNFTGPEATVACQDGQQCAGFKAVIGSTFHGVQAIGYEKSTT